MRRSPSLKARRSPDIRWAITAAAAVLLAATELIQWASSGSAWLFGAVRLAILLAACAVLGRMRPPARDGLTGAADHAAYARCLAEGVPGEQICVFFLDVDDLKGTNDTCGHEAGDRLLLRLAASFDAVMGARDRLFRVGGDEFVLLAADMTAAEAPDFLRRWKAELGRLNRDQLPALTVSCGWAAGRGCDFSALARQADDAMYRMKNEKRS